MASPLPRIPNIGYCHDWLSVFFKYELRHIFLIFFQLPWVFVAVLGFSLIVANRATVCCGAQVSHCSGFSGCGAQAQERMDFRCCGPQA